MTTIHIQPQTVNNWNDKRTSASRPPHVRIFASEEFFTSDGVLIPAGSPNGGPVYKDIACTQSGTVVTIPAFDIDSTRDATSLSRTSSYSFYFYTTSGAKISLFLSGITVPDEIDSTSGCAPSGTCCTLDDLAAYNTPSPSLPPDTYPTFAVVRQLIQSALGTAQGPAGTNKQLQYNDDGVFGAVADSIIAGGRNLSLPTLAIGLSENGDIFQAGPASQRLTLNPYSTDVAGSLNTGGAPLVFRPTLHYISPTDFRSVGMGIVPAIGATAGGESSFWTPYWLLFGNRTTPIPAGTKGNPSGFEVNHFTNQSAADMSEALHAFGYTVEGHGGAPLYGTALSFDIDTVAANILAHNTNIAKNVAGGTQNAFFGSASGSQSPSAIYSGAGTWNYGIDLSSILVNLGVFRAANNAPAFVARNAANTADVTILYLSLVDRIVMGGSLTIPIADAFVQIGLDADGYLFQKVDSGGRMRFFRQGYGEVLNILGQNPIDGTTAMQLLVTKGAVTSLVPVVVGAVGSAGAGLRALAVAN